MHFLLERMAEPNKLTALDKEVCGLSPAILVDVGVPVAPPIEDFVYRRWRLVTALMLLYLLPRILPDTLAAASIVCCLAEGHRGCRRAHCLCSLLLPCRSGPRRRNGFVCLYVVLDTLLRIVPLGHWVRLANDDGFEYSLWNLPHRPTHLLGS
jgi:hypothetical protein